MADSVQWTPAGMKMEISRHNTPSMVSSQTTKRRARGRQEGSEELEFAFVVLLLVTLMLGIFWFARAYNVHETMTRAAREGARVAAMPSAYAAGNTYLDGNGTANLSASVVFADYVAPVLRSAHLNPNEVTNYSEQVTWLDPTDPRPQCGVVVYFEYPFMLHIPFTGAKLASITLKASAQMRRETQSAAGKCP